MNPLALLAALLPMVAGEEAIAVPNDPNPPSILRIPPPPSRFEQAAPLPALPAVMLEREANGWGLAQQTARARGVQARILWVDATANIDRVNTDEKVAALVRRVKEVGFNTIVFDIKPISGQVMYKSKIAPKLLEWRGRQLPADFDPLAAFVRECRAQGLPLHVSLNAFSEGHRDFKVGPGYGKPEWQTVLYEPRLIIRSAAGVPYEISGVIDQMPASGEMLLGGFDESARVPAPVAGMSAVSIDRTGLVLEYLEYSTSVGARLQVPRGGSVLVGVGDAARYLRDYVQAGTRVSFDTDARFLPISARPDQQIPLMTNPNSPQVQEYALSLLREVLANYRIDGLIYDDRLRFGGLNADFSPASQFAFEQWLGRRLKWPDDVFRFTLNANMSRGIVPGPHYDAWMTWRALTMRNFVARARDVTKQMRPNVLFGIYAGSWYGDYPRFGNNWASPEAESAFWFHTPDYGRTGIAPLLDFLITGCYYPTATIHEALGLGIGIGATVEAGGQLTNRLVRDATWSYAGIMLSDFRGNARALSNALQAAVGSTQGVMVFDLSHDIEPMWNTFRDAFRDRKGAPHDVPGLLADVRRRRAALDRMNPRDRPIPINQGTPGTGF